MTLEDTITKIRERLSRKDEAFHKESAVEDGIIGPLLTALGWPVGDTRIVRRQYPVSGGSVDYALCHSARVPAVFVEAKNIGGIDKSGEEQLSRYVSSSQQEVPIAVLTDGVEWIFYATARSRNFDFQDSKIKQINLASDSIEECTGALRRYLNFQDVRSYVSIKHAEDDHWKLGLRRKAKSHLSEVWGTLVSAPHPDFVTLLCEGTEEICGVKADPEDSAEFIQKMRPEANNAPMPNFTPAAVPQQRTMVTNRPGANRAPRTKIRKIEFLGEVQSFKKNYEALAWLLHALDKKFPGFMERFSTSTTDRTITRNPNEWVVGDSEKYIRDNVRPVGGGWYMYTTLNTKAYEDKVMTACEVAGVGYGREVKLYIS